MQLLCLFGDTRSGEAKTSSGEASLTACEAS